MYRSLGRGAEHPFQGFSKALIIAIESAIRLAMSSTRLRELQASIQSATEDQITLSLQEELIEIRNSHSSFTEAVFEIPARGASVANFDRTKINKSPDLHFCIRVNALGECRDPLQRAWFCECKLIELSHSSRTIQKYITKGVQRFQAGDYAWAMPHAQMIAYVRGYTPETMVADKQLIKALGNPSFTQDGATVITEHERHFMLPNGESPDNITLRHMWFYI